MRLCLLLPALLAAATSVLADDAPNSQVTVQVVGDPVDTGIPAEEAILNEWYFREVANNSTATEASADGGNKIVCHTKIDDFGPECPKDKTFTKEVFDAATFIWCDQYRTKVITPTGQWYNTKLVNYNCDTDPNKNQGHKCNFVGVIRMDRDAERGSEGAGWNYINSDRCQQYSNDIWNACGGQGGYINVPWGTHFMYCTSY
ncbi:hypothetical protein K491DRAFT_684623 [Lophiostoma macrostomum CBS 122681]|uniref:Ecp2 effector protein domain-containing protein n=1 Tax=Lophiostoma macrostomum CBS 122681 TaxID=1314788 RepID=A0A6A6SQT0_9PLEO|nr:hypothetical protein K491DRAFT_684623 [Lophiostoma macrostomum CBS 122681]